MPKPHAADCHVARHLRALPDPVPPAALETRLRAAHAHRGRWLRGGMGVVAVGLFALAFLPALMAPDLQPPLAHGPGPKGGASQQIPHQRQVQAIDRALQAAYARGAGDDEVAPLWQARERLMAGARTPGPSGSPSRG
ncbi:hypothetical protein H4F99_06470 [Lysobacter sp. SG-8]|uniref:Uncharacterized protein n=1 Tax=Marilutibacter penaei TaxID=2759900 RepID=A0A7W3U3B8_9GAMM|nr:hypothetical protein [Lysobacter penaei]MBB1088132.1 hypothetical protein [Lysobacter penaei]